MLISLSHEFVFLPVPRTGSMSMRRAIGSLCAGHEKPFYTGPRPMHPLAHDVFTAHPELRDYFSFSFVRNPFDRLVSLYAWHQGSDPRQLYTGLEPLPYLQALLAAEPWQFKQRSYTHDPDGTQLVSFIGRFEHLQFDWGRINERLGIVRLLPHCHRTPHPPHPAWHDVATTDFIAEHCADDLSYFGYCL